MPDPDTYEYTIIRVVPKVERGECLNAGVILYCKAQSVLAAKVELDAARLRAIDPAVDLDEVRAHLDAVVAICDGGEHAGPIGRMSQSERFDWLAAPRSTIIQMSPVHTGACRDARQAIDRLFDTMVRSSGAAAE